MITYEQMVPGFRQLAVAHRVDLNEAQLVIYAQYLGTMCDSVDEWNWIVEQTIITLKFWPSIAELMVEQRNYRRHQQLGATGATVELAAATEWLVALRCMSTPGPMYPAALNRRTLVSELSPLGFEAALLAELPGAEMKDLHPGTRKRFVEMYLALDRQGEVGVVRQIAQPQSEALAPASKDI